MNAIRRFPAAFAALFLALTTPFAGAGKVAGDVGVGATVIDSCVASGGAAQLDKSMLLTLRCPLTTPYSVAVSTAPGTARESTLVSSVNDSGSSVLSYRLGTALVPTATGSGGLRSSRRRGSANDTVTVTITY